MDRTRILTIAAILLIVGAGGFFAYDYFELGGSETSIAAEEPQPQETFAALTINLPQDLFDEEEGECLWPEDGHSVSLVVRDQGQIPMGTTVISEFSCKFEGFVELPDVELPDPEVTSPVSQPASIEVRYGTVRVIAAPLSAIPPAEEGGAIRFQAFGEALLEPDVLLPEMFEWDEPFG